MIQRIMLVSNILKMVMLISGSISLLHLSVINDTNLMAFPQNDKVLIGGTYYSSSSSNKNASAHAIILLHMLGHDRNDWNLFASTLLHMLGHDRNDWNPFASTLSNNSIGYAVLSIDLRGHGESLDQNGKA